GQCHPITAIEAFGELDRTRTVSHRFHLQLGLTGLRPIANPKTTLLLLTDIAHLRPRENATREVDVVQAAAAARFLILTHDHLPSDQKAAHLAVQPHCHTSSPPRRSARGETKTPRSRRRGRCGASDCRLRALPP